MAISPRVRLPGISIVVYSSLPLLATLVFAVAPAQAQNSVIIRSDQLEKVGPYHARRQVMILDETPRVVDYRRPKETTPNYLINIGPVPSASSQPGTIVLTPEHNGLSQSGFQSQIPAGGFSKPGLSPAVMGGHAPIDDAGRQLSQDGNSAGGARPLMSTKGRVGPHTSPPSTTPVSYSRYASPGGNSFDTRFTARTTADVTGKMLHCK